MVQKTGIFICPSCQTAVKGGPGEDGTLVCPECQHQFGTGSGAESPKAAATPAAVPAGRKEGRSSSVIRNLTARKAEPVKPVGVIEPPVMEAKTLEEARADGHSQYGDEEIIMPDGTRRVRRRKRKSKDGKNKGLILFLLGWFSVIALIFILFKSGDGDSEEQRNQDQATAESNEVRNRELMRRLLPTISKRFFEFLGYPTVSGREQFIDRSSELSSAFTRFYDQEAFPKPQSSLRRIDENILEFSDDNIAIETVWEDEEGHRWGAVHVFDKVESWKLDWECFAPYSSESWARFRANLGSQEGVFRLLVRKRRVTSEKETFSLSFYRAPQVFETDNEYKNTQSPEVEVAVDSEVGKEFLKRWQDYQEGKSPYGSILPQHLDPRNHLRVTARLAWEENKQGESKMVLKDLVGVGWFGKRIQQLHEENVQEVTEEAKDQLNAKAPKSPAEL